MPLNKTLGNDDTDLFLRVKKGDDEAFSALFSKYYPRVLNIVYRFLGNKDEAEDIAQDVFLRAYRASKTFVPKSKFSTWLYRITVNRCFSRYKQLRRDQEKFSGEVEFRKNHTERPAIIDNSPSLDPSPSDAALQKESHHEIQTALDKLPPDQKMALILREYEGRSYKKIARISGCSVKAVERRIYHARQRLKELLAE